MASNSEEMAPLINKNNALQEYYHTIESRLGYQIVLGGTRHFGYYERDKYNPFPIGAALRRMEDYLAKKLNLPSGSQVLDAGCGVGHVALRLAEAHSLEVQGIDVVEHHLEKARQNIEKYGMKGRVNVGRMDYHHLDGIASSSLDGVYTMETFVHSTSAETVASEFYRVLKPGGRVVLFEYEHSDMSLEPQERVNSWRTINEYSAMPGFDRFTSGTIRSIFTDAGFTNVQMEDITTNVKPMVRFFFILAYIPYLFVSTFGLQKYFINTMAGIEGWRCRNSIQYVVVSGTKPKEDGSEFKLKEGESRKLK